MVPLANKASACWLPVQQLARFRVQVGRVWESRGRCCSQGLISLQVLYGVVIPPTHTLGHACGGHNKTKRHAASLAPQLSLGGGLCGLHVGLRRPRDDWMRKVVASAAQHRFLTAPSVIRHTIWIPRRWRHAWPRRRRGVADTGMATAEAFQETHRATGLNRP